MTDLNPILTKIKSLMEERGWSYYRLAKEADIPYSSLNSMFLKNTQPTIPTLEKLCEGLHVSLPEFFSDKPPYREITFELSNDEKFLVDLFRRSTHSDQKVILAYLKGYCHEQL